MCARVIGIAHQLKGHIRTVHMKDGRKCEECDKLFSGSGGLQKHIKYVHVEKMKSKSG